jgi:hypothetical protein
LKFYSKSFILTLSNPNFLPHAYSPALNYFGRERVLKEKNINRNRKKERETGKS